jgi:hypothetical protein
MGSHIAFFTDEAVITPIAPAIAALRRGARSPEFLARRSRSAAIVEPGATGLRSLVI